MASILWYLTADLNLLGLFDGSVGLTTKCAMMKVLENVKEDETLSQTRLGLTNTKIKTIYECVTKNRRRLIRLTNQLKILVRAASKVLSRCLSSTPITLLLIKTQLPLLKITVKHQALSYFGLLCASSHNHLILAPLAKNQ